ncbi:hypothetical protein GCM10025861_08010 [Methanobacterium petrolearium]|nr:hypothetical protein GCM10025861_08010 [Methanobacterium petrolearium]
MILGFKLANMVKYICFNLYTGVSGLSLGGWICPKNAQTLHEYKREISRI